MATTSAVLGVYVLDETGSPLRAGSLVRDTDDTVVFTAAESFLRDPMRPVLSLGWYDPVNDAITHERLARRDDKIGLHGALPPWFSGLLPEGAIKEMVLSEMTPGDHDEFDILARLGADLPGALVVAPETGAPPSTGPLTLEQSFDLEAPLPQGAVTFPLAGVQLALTAKLVGGRLAVPTGGNSGRHIIKLGSDRLPDLPEAEYGAMRLAALVGVRTAACRLLPRDAVDGIPPTLPRCGKHVLVVDRVDRDDSDRRIHTENAGQVLGMMGDPIYTMATTETIINMVRRFSTDHRDDVLEAIRRVVANVLLGNGDNHLKHWSFVFPRPGEIRLAPAYDIVPTAFYTPAETMALRFVKTHAFESVNMQRFERLASFLRLDQKLIAREVANTVRRALAVWPSAAPALFGEDRAGWLLSRLETLSLVHDVRAAREEPAEQTG